MLKVYQQKFSSNCHHTIRIINDEDFERPDHRNLDLWNLDINQGSWNDSVKIQPHYGENTQNMELFKLKIYCEKNNIQVISRGRLNQLPLLSQISDRVELESKNNMVKIYSDGSHYLNHRKEIPPKRNSQLWEKSWQEISDEEVIDRFMSTTVCIRRSSYEFFIKEKFPKRLTVAEVRIGNNQQRRHISDNAPMKITGLDYSFQKQLVEKSKDHYMSVQVLGSLLNQWSFLCGGGSANLHCLLPVNWLLLTETPKHFGFSTINIIRGLARSRYGEIGDIVPVIDTSTRWTKNLNIDKNTWRLMDNACKSIRQEVSLV